MRKNSRGKNAWSDYVLTAGHLPTVATQSFWFSVTELFLLPWFCHGGGEPASLGITGLPPRMLGEVKGIVF